MMPTKGNGKGARERGKQGKDEERKKSVKLYIPWKMLLAKEVRADISRRTIPKKLFKQKI